MGEIGLLYDLFWYDLSVIKKVISKRNLDDLSPHDDLSYWLTRPPEERVSAVEILRRQHDGCTSRLQRVARVVERAQG